MGAKVVVADSIRVTVVAGGQHLQDINEWPDFANYLDAIFTVQTFEIEKSNATQQVDIVIGTVGEKNQDNRAAPSGPVWDMVTFSNVTGNKFYKYAAVLDSAATNGTTNKPMDRWCFFIVNETGTNATGTVAVSLRATATAKRPG